MRRAPGLQPEDAPLMAGGEGEPVCDDEHARAGRLSVPTQASIDATMSKLALDQQSKEKNEWGIARDRANPWLFSIPAAPTARTRGRLRTVYFTAHGSLGSIEQASDRVMRSYVARVETWEHELPALQPTCELYGLKSKSVHTRMSANCEVLASASKDSSAVRVWRLKTGAWVDPIVLRGPSHDVICVAVSTGGDLVAGGTSEVGIQLWKLDEGSRHAPALLAGHVKAVTALAFSPDSTRLASGGADRAIHIWALDRQPAALLASVTGHDDTVSCLSYSASGRLLVSGSGDMTLKVWDVASEDSATISARTLRGHRDWIHCACFSDDGRFIVSGSDDHVIHVWPLDADLTETAPLVLRGPLGGVHTVCVSPDGSMVASASFDDTLFLWNTRPWCSAAQPTCLRGHDLHVNGVAMSPDGIHVASGSADRTVRVWNVQTDVREVMVLRGHEEIVTSVCYSPCGTLIVSGSIDNTVRIWDVSESPNARPATVLTGHKDWINGVAYSRDGRLIGSASDDHTVRIWLAACPATTQPMVLVGHKEWVQSVSFSPNSRMAASGAQDCTFLLWHVADFVDGAQLSPFRVFPGHDGAVFSVSFSPDGQFVASGSMDSTVRVWDTSDPDCDPILLSGHEGHVRVVAFSADGKLICSGSTDRSLRVWDVDTREEMLCFRMSGPSLPYSMVADACWSPNMEAIAGSCGADVFVFRSSVTRRNLAAVSSMFVVNDVSNKSEAELAQYMLAPAGNDDVRMWTLDLFAARVFVARVSDIQLDDNGVRMYLPQPEFDEASSSVDEAEAAISVRLFEYALVRRKWPEASIELLLGMMLKYKDDPNWAFHVDQFCWRTLGPKYPRLMISALRSLRLFHNTHKLPQLDSRRKGFWAFCTHGRGIDDLDPARLADTIRSQRKLTMLHHHLTQLFRRVLRMWGLHGPTEPAEPMLVQTLSLVNVGHLPYVRQHKCDILEILASHNIAEGFATPTVRCLLHVRWLAVEPYFYLHVFLYLLLLVCFAVYTSHVATEPNMDLFPQSSVTGVLFGAILLLINGWFLLCAVTAAIKAPRRYFREFWSALDAVHILFFAAAGSHFARSESQYLLASITSVLLWIKVLYFARGFRGTGIFLRMFFLMVYAARFYAVIMAIILFGFSNAFMIVFRGRDVYHSNFGSSLVTQIAGIPGGLIPVMEGTDAYDDVFGGSPDLYRMQLVLFGVYMFAMTVLLLNVLIAIVFEVYSIVVRDAAEHFHLEKTKLLLDLERLTFLRGAHKLAWMHIAAPAGSSVWVEDTAGPSSAGESAPSMSVPVGVGGSGSEIDRLREELLARDKALSEQVAAAMATVRKMEENMAAMTDMIKRMAPPAPPAAPPVPPLRIARESSSASVSVLGRSLSRVSETGSVPVPLTPTDERPPVLLTPFRVSTPVSSTATTSAPHHMVAPQPVGAVEPMSIDDGPASSSNSTDHNTCPDTVFDGVLDGSDPPQPVVHVEEDSL